MVFMVTESSETYLWLVPKDSISSSDDEWQESRANINVLACCC